MKLRYTSSANQDLVAALDYLRENASASTAAKLLVQIDKSLDLISTGLIQGPAVNLEGRTVRALSVPPFKIYYVIAEDTVVVLRIYHQSRLPIEEP
jgi:plasmid stabilization system protein ParE